MNRNLWQSWTGLCTRESGEEEAKIRISLRGGQRRRVGLGGRGKREEKSGPPLGGQREIDHPAEGPAFRDDLGIRLPLGFPWLLRNVFFQCCVSKSLL